MVSTRSLAFNAAAENSATIRPPAHRENAVCDREDLLEIGRHNQDRFAACRKIPNDVMDLAFCADVDALSRFVEKKHIGVCRQPFR